MLSHRTVHTGLYAWTCTHVLAGVSHSWKFSKRDLFCFCFIFCFGLYFYELGRFYDLAGASRRVSVVCRNVYIIVWELICPPWYRTVDLATFRPPCTVTSFVLYWPLKRVCLFVFRAKSSRFIEHSNELLGFDQLLLKHCKRRVLANFYLQDDRVTSYVTHRC